MPAAELSLFRKRKTTAVVGIDWTDGGAEYMRWCCGFNMLSLGSGEVNPRLSLRSTEDVSIRQAQE